MARLKFLMLFVVSFVLIIRSEYRLATWGSTLGTVTVHQHQEVTKEDGQIGYRPQIGFRFRVAGNEYFGNAINAPNVGVVEVESRLALSTYHDRYPVGSSVQVFYAPSSPKDACLVLERDWLGYALLAVTIAVFLRCRS